MNAINCGNGKDLDFDSSGNGILPEHDSDTTLAVWHLDIRSGVMGWSFDTDGAINLQARNWGQTIDDFVDLVPRQDRDRVQSAFAKLQNGGRRFDVVHGMKSNSALFSRVFHSGRKFLPSGDEPACAVGVLRPNRAAEVQPTRSNSAKAVHDLIRYLTHNMVDILSGIIVPSRIIRGASSIGAAAPWVGYIEKSGQQGLELLNKLKKLDLFASEPPTTVDVSELVGQVLESRSEMFQRLCVSVEFRFDGEARATVCPGGLAFVVQSLLSNSIEAMPDGGAIVLWVRTDRKGVTVEISDSGKGIQSADTERVFDLLFTTKDEFGAGFSLYESRLLVESWGGKLQARSAPSGATFTIWFPTAPATAPGDH